MTSSETLKVRSVLKSINHDEEERHESLLEFANIILSRRKLIGGLGLLFATAATAYVLLKPRTYTTGFSFMPSVRNSAAPAGAAGIAAQLGINISGATGTTSPQFYVDLLKTRGILQPVVEHKYKVGGREATLIDLLHAKGSTDAERRDDAMLKLGKHMGSEASLKTGVISVSILTDDPNLSQQVAAEVFDELNRYNLQTRQSQATAEREFTEKRLAQASDELRAAENELEQFTEANHDLRPPRIALEQDRLTRLVTFRRSLYQQLAANLEQAKLDEVRDTPVLTVVESPSIPSRPDKRGVGYKLLGGFFGGVMLGIFIVFANVFFQRSREKAAPTFEEFTRLKQETLEDLLHPWRAVGRSRSRERTTH